MYKTSDGRVAKNNLYQKQLLDDLGCASVTESDVKNLRYRLDDLVRIVTRYNSRCSGSEHILYGEKKIKRDLFNLSLRPRVGRPSLEISNDAQYYGFSADYGSWTQFGLGVDAEMIMPFFRNKWAVTFEPTLYKGFKSVQSVRSFVLRDYEDLFLHVNYKAIEMPLGLRYYMFLNERSKLSVSASYLFNISAGSRIDFSGSGSYYYEGIEMDTRPAMLFGLGYKFNNRFGLEGRYYLKRDITGNYIYWKSAYNVVSLALGISLF